MEHFNKRNKTSDMLFKLVEYGCIAFGLNSFLPDSPITPLRALMGLGILILIFITALLVTPEDRDIKEKK